jgi:flavin-dependent dehydrogenase
VGLALLTAAQVAGERWDALVIGAGPAGSAAAISLARAGRRVLVVDREAHPRVKVCGCCLGPLGQRVLDELGVTLAGGGDGVAGARTIDRVTLASRGVRAELVMPEMLVIGRDELDVRLLREAVACGASVAWPVVGRVLDGQRAELRWACGASVTVRAHVTLACDGLAGSAVRGVQVLEARVARGSRVGLSAVVDAGPDAAAWPAELDGLCMCVGRDGYVGAVRLACGRLDLAAAVDPRAVGAMGGGAKVARAVIAEALGRGDALAEMLAGATERAARAGAWRGTPPLTRRRRELTWRSTLVVGDCAGYVEPFTGEGMGWALMAGGEAGRLCELALAAPAAQRENMLAGWTRRWHELLVRRRTMCGVVAGVARRPAVTAGLVSFARLMPGVAARAMIGVGLAASGEHA